MLDRSTRFDVLALVTVSLLVGAYGCTVNATPPSSTDDPTDPAPTATTTATTAPTTAPTTTSTTPAPTTTTTAPAPTTTAPTPTPTATTTSTSTTFPPPPPPVASCTAASVHETESNDTAATANSFGSALSFCGAVSPGEVDFVAFHAPAQMTGLSWSAAWNGFGTPTITVTVAGVTYPAGATMKVVPGQDYIFEIQGGNSPESYAIAVSVAVGAP